MMKIYFEEALDYVRENWSMVLAIVIMVLMLIGYFIFTINTLIPRWRLRTDLALQASEVEAAFSDRTQTQQSAAGQIPRQIEAVQAGFDQKANLFLTEAQAALFLDGLYNDAALFGVSIVDLQAVAVPRSAPDGQKPVFDTRQFRLVVEGSFSQLNGFVGSIEDTAVPSISLWNLLITAEGDGLPDILTLDLLLYTSPYSTGEPVADLPVGTIPTPVVPAATPIPQVLPTPTATVPPTPDVNSLVAQLDELWAVEDWPQVINLIQEIRQLDPTYPDMTEKLYAARVNFGYQLAGLGDTTAAAEQFEQALAIFPDGGEAEAGLQSLFAPTATPTPAVTIYIVQRGDTLFSIARRYGSSVDAVKAANGLTSNNITPGQQLIIP